MQASFVRTQLDPIIIARYFQATDESFSYYPGYFEILIILTRYIVHFD